MNKISPEFIQNQYRSGVESYAEFTKQVGLWASELYVFNKYLKIEDRILDVGCGTGRTTFPLYQLGYTNIIGIDLTPEMINKAQELNSYFNASIDFRIGDATQLDFPKNQFDQVIFSFNGLMSIPMASSRTQAIREIHRVLKPSGIFIFTTHDRAEEPSFQAFWEQEAKKWAMGQQSPALYEYGDLITQSKNESGEIFIHIPDQKEILDMLSQNHFELIETFYRSHRFEESESVKSRSGECRFWIAKAS